MKLYSYYRSSAAYRVRIALELKELAFELAPVNLLEGEHRDEVYRAINPQAWYRRWRPMTAGLLPSRARSSSGWKIPAMTRPCIRPIRMRGRWCVGQSIRLPVISIR